jgi:hypothetical protein
MNKAGMPWKNSMRLDSLISLEGVEPWEFMEKINLTPMLSVAAVVDPLPRPLKALREAFASARQPKPLVELPKGRL